jgi:fluoride exporter
MLKVLIIGCGGFFGSISRYLVGGIVHKILDQPFFPYGTLTVNILGCFLIGFLNGMVETRQFFSPEIRSLVFIGFLGGFTTFSTFGYESFSFMRDGQYGSTIANITIHIVLGLSAVVFGHYVSRFI